MTEPAEKKKRESTAERMARLGLKNQPGWQVPKNRFPLARRIRRESDENWFKKPNSSNDDKE